MPAHYSDIPNGLNIVVIACKVFKDLIERHIPAELSHRVAYLDYGLHRVPVNLNQSLQETMDTIEQPSLILLGYGLCGNGLNGIRAGKHVLLVPRTDDCIAILLGSYTEYIHQFSKIPGTIYLSKGWLESGSNPLQEYQEYVSKYGEETAIWLMDQQYQHYERLVFVAHNQQDLEEYRTRVLDVAQFCKRWNMRYEEILGSEDYIRLLVETALDKNFVSDDFVLVKPGGEIHQDQFIRRQGS